MKLARMMKLCDAVDFWDAHTLVAATVTSVHRSLGVNQSRHTTYRQLERCVDSGLMYRLENGSEHTYHLTGKGMRLKDAFYELPF